MRNVIKHCRSCNVTTQHSKNSMITIFCGLVLTVISGGFFLPIWLLIVLLEALLCKWHCSSCGSGAMAASRIQRQVENRKAIVAEAVPALPAPTPTKPDATSDAKLIDCFWKEGKAAPAKVVPPPMPKRTPDDRAEIEQLKRRITTLQQASRTRAEKINQLRNALASIHNSAKSKQPKLAAFCAKALGPTAKVKA